MSLKITPYKPADKVLWDSFISQSRNGTFLFKRDYMEYHKDRFTDHSLLCFENGVLIAVLPANKEGQKLYSHRGLTYGGFVVSNIMKLPKFLELFIAFIEYCNNVGFKHIYYKTIPHIYTKYPTEEDLYALFMVGAKLISRSMLTVVKPQAPIEWQAQRKRAAAKARKHGIRVEKTDDFGSYWHILEQVLRSKFESNPVHSLAEISRLQNFFPENIKLFAAYQNDIMLSGVLVYESEQAARAQYIAANEQGKASGALDLIFQYLLQDVYNNKPYFEFGTSELKNTQNYLNMGLVNQKEGFGARSVAQDTYLIELDQVQIDIVNDMLS